MHVPFLDLKITDANSRKELVQAIERIFVHGRILMGPELDEFEGRLAAYCGTRYAVGVSSGTDALFIALRALGIGEGDEVITTCLSFVGTANGIALTGAKPVFADISDDLTLDVESVSAAITPRTKAIMPVHFTGKLCRMPELLEIAAHHGLKVVEDAAPAIGASWNGRKAGSFSAAAALSMNPMKILNACGEAGAVLTDDPAIRERVLALRYNGVVNKEFCYDVSLNGRLDTIQAAILSRRLDGLEAVIAKRRAIADRYRDGLSDVVETPREAAGYRDVYYTYTVRANRRDQLAAYLAERGIETKVQHAALIPEHPAFKADDLCAFPVGRRQTGRILCLPMHESLRMEQIEYVIAMVREFYMKDR